MDVAPIALFAYKRPRHVLKVLKALSKNYLADQSDLFIYCDGPEEDADKRTIADIHRVRKVVRLKQWCKKITIIESATNIGLADSIVRGVTDIGEQYGKVIVLEDDIVTSRGFLEYMNNSLRLYEYDEQVFQISAFMVPSESNLEPTGFFRAPASWGWATWQRAWEKYVHDIDSLIKFAESVDRSQFNLESTYDLFDQLVRNKNGELNTWGVRFYTSIRMHDGLTLYPKKSFVKNIGFDKYATNTKSHAIRQSTSHKPEDMNPEKIPVRESESFYRAFLDFYEYQNYLWSKPTISERVQGRLNRMLKR